MVAGGVGLAPFATLAEALRARGVTTTLFYGARSAAELFYLDFFRELGVDLVLTTEDGSLGETRPHHRAARRRAFRARPSRAGHALRLRTRRGCWPRPRMSPCATAALLRCRSSASWDAEWAAVTAALCRCAEAMAASITCGPASPGRAAGGSDSLGLARGHRTFQCNIGPADAQEPAHCGQRLLRLRRGYAEAIDLSSLGGVAVKGLFLAEREGHAGAADRRDPGRHAERHRLFRASASGASSPKSCQSCARGARPSSSTSAGRRSTNTSRSPASSRTRKASRQSS